MPLMPTGYIELVTQAGYWRKANAIHAWFVREVQGGVDECQRSEVELEKLKELGVLCLFVLGQTQMADGLLKVGERWTPESGWEQMLEEGKLIANPHIAQEHLPNQPGFFFGSQEYDEYYVRDLTDTLDIVDRCVKADEAADGHLVFYYRASW